VAREKLAGGKEAGDELLTGPAAQDYSDTALPRQTIDSPRSRRRSSGRSISPPRVTATSRTGRRRQTNGIPTQWSGRVTAMAVDPRCDEDYCRLYVGAAGGGVWRTDNVLARHPRWKPLTDSFDTTSVGHLLIDSHDKSGRTIYLGTGEPSGSSDSEAGLGLYKSTDRGEHWRLVPGSRSVAKDRGIGEVVVDPNDKRHIFIGTTVARHSLSGVSGGRFTPPNAPTIGVYESLDGGESFQLVLNRAQDPVDPTSPTGNDFFKGGVTDIEYDPVDRRTLYAGMFEYGVFRSRDNGATWENIYVGTPDDGSLGAFLGIRYEVAAAKLPNGKTRLVRHADRDSARQAGRGLDRRRHAVRRAAALPRGRPLERPQRDALDQRGRALHRHVRRHARPLRGEPP
jgi:hypothetical protein